MKTLILAGEKSSSSKVPVESAELELKSDKTSAAGRVRALRRTMWLTLRNLLLGRAPLDKPAHARVVPVAVASSRAVWTRRAILRGTSPRTPRASTGVLEQGHSNADVG